MSGLGTTHRGPDVGSGVAEAEGEPPRRRVARVVAVLAAIALLVGGLVWAVNVEPLRAGSGTYGVWGQDIELTAVSPGIRAGGGPSFFDGDRDYRIAAWTPGARITLRFPVTNTSWVPIRLVEVFPDGLAGCGWQPDAAYAADPMDADMAPFEPVTLWPGRHLDIAVTGTMHCDFPWVPRDGLTGFGGVDVRYRVAGIVPRDSWVDNGYTLFWTESPIEQAIDESSWLDHAGARNVYVVPPLPLLDVLRNGRPGWTPTS